MFENESPEAAPDLPLNRVVDALRASDPTGARMAREIRRSFDMLYNGQHTGRFSPADLYKTEKTHVGSVVEIELRRALSDVIGDGKNLDYLIAGEEVDCKFSFRDGGWMLPPECLDEVLLVITADDLAATWSAGLVRASPANVRTSTNRDAKTSLNPTGRGAIRWLVRNGDLPENVLLRLAPDVLNAVLAPKSGQQRVNELFRRVTLRPITRTTIATVAQQDDFMKRVRYNGGARSSLQPEGYLIPGGDYEAHRHLALDLGAPDIGPGEFLSVRVVPTAPGTSQAVELEGLWWRIAEPDDTVAQPAPALPTTRAMRA